MHFRRNTPFFLAMACTFGIAVVAIISADAAPRKISRDVLRDKIRGGWAGQMIGVAYGAPTEFKSNGKINDAPLEWKSGMLANTIHQDDLYVEMTFAAVMDRIGLNATSQDYGRAFKDSKYQLWHANAGARRALNQGIQPPWSGHPKYNFHANDIDFQIEADFIGLMSPGLPRESGKYCERVGCVMNYGDGIYGGMFVCGMYSAAYFESDPRKVVEAGLACIPAKSEYGRLIRDVLDWSAANPDDWRKVWQMIQEKWDGNDVCPDGVLSPFNIDAKINGAYIALGVLYGGKDFRKTMEITTRCGQDSDCNPSSAAGVLGVMLGYRAIPQEFTVDMPSLENTKFDFTDYSFNDIVRSTEQRALKIINEAGGTVTEQDVTIPVQKPKAPKLEQWTPGKPKARIAASDAAWTWSKEWEPDSRKTKSWMEVKTAGAEAALRFNGVAVALIGHVDQQAGRADVQLDGKPMPTLDGYIAEGTHDHVLWQTYGLKPGDHVLRIVSTGKADSRSKGTRVAIESAVIYGEK